MADKPRLAIITRLFPAPHKPEAGGFNREQLRRLVPHYDVSVLVPVPFEEWIAHRGELASTRLDGMDVRYAAWAFPPRVGRTIYPACFAASLLPQLRWLRAIDPHCVVTSWVYPDAVGATALKLAARIDAPMIIKAHGSDINVHAVGSTLTPQARWAVRRASALVTVSEALRARAVELGMPADKVVVVRNGVDTGLFAPMPRAEARRQIGAPPDRRIILFVGGMLETKGVTELLSAFTLLARTHDDVDLVLVGDGPEAKTLRSRSDAAGLSERVKLVGRVPHEALNPYFNAASLVCLPSYREGLPNVLLEAIACGVPCVATRVGGIPEVVTPQTGMLVAARDAVGLHAALAEALGHDWDAAAIARHALGFTWEANTYAMRSLIDRAIAARAGGAASGR